MFSKMREQLQNTGPFDFWSLGSLVARQSRLVFWERELLSRNGSFLNNEEGGHRATRMILLFFKKKVALYFVSQMIFLGKVWPQLPEKPSQNAKRKTQNGAFGMVTTPFSTTKFDTFNMFFSKKNTIKSSEEIRKKLSSLRRS